MAFSPPEIGVLPCTAGLTIYEQKPRAAQRGCYQSSIMRFKTRDCRTACRTVATRYAKVIRQNFSADHDHIRSRALWKHEDYRELHSGVTLEGVSEVGAARSRGFLLYLVLCREVFCCLVLRHHSIVDILVSDTLPSLRLDRQASAVCNVPSYSSFVASRLASLKIFQTCLSFLLEPHMVSGLGYAARGRSQKWKI